MAFHLHQDLTLVPRMTNTLSKIIAQELMNSPPTGSPQSYIVNYKIFVTSDAYKNMTFAITQLCLIASENIHLL